MFPRTPSTRRDFVTPPPSPAAQSRGGNPVSPTSPLLAAADAPHRRGHTGEPECSPEPPQRGVTSSRRLLRAGLRFGLGHAEEQLLERRGVRDEGEDLDPRLA